MNKNLERGECSTLKVNENDNSVVLDNFEEQAKVSIINNKESGKAYQKAFEGEKGLKPDVEEPPNFEESPDFEEPQDFKESPHIPLNSQINENIMQAEGREPSDSEKFTNIMRKTGVRLFNMDPFNSYCKLLYTIEEELSSEEPPDFPPPPPINKNTMQTEKQLLVNGPNNLDTSSNQIPYQTEGDNHSKVKPNHQKRLADQRHVSTNRRSKRFCEQPSDSEKPSEDESLDNSSNHPMNKNMMQAERRSLSNPIQAPYQNNKQISNQISTNNNSNVILKHQKRVVVNQQVVPINLISGTDCEQPNEFEETADCESLTDFEEVYSSPNPTVNKNMLHTKRRSLSNQIQAKKQKKYAQITNQIHTTNNSNVKNNHQQSVVENDQGVPINLLSLPDFEEPSDCEQPSYCEEPSYCEQPLDCGQPSDCKQLTDFKEPTHSSPNAAVNKNMMQAERRALRNPKQATIQKNTKIPNQMYANNNSNVKNNHQQRVVVNEQGVPLSLISRPGFEEPTDSSNRTFNKNLMHAERGLINNEPKNLAPVCNQIPATYPNSPNSSQTYIDPHSEVTPNNPKSFKNLPRVPIDLEEAFKALLPNYLPPNIQTQKVAHSEVDTIPKKTLADLHGAPSNIRPKPDFEEPANCEEPFDYEGQAYFGEPSDCEEPTDFDPNQSSFPPNHFSPNHTMMHAEIGMVPNGSNNLPPFVNKIKAAYPNIPNPSETYIDPHSEVTPKNQKSVENIQRIPIGLEEALKDLLPNYLSPGISTKKVAHSEVDATPKKTLADLHGAPSNIKPKPDFEEPANCEEPFDYEGQAYFGEPSDCEEPTDFDPNQSSFPPNHFSPNHTMMHAEIGMVPNGSNNLPPFVNKIKAAYPNIPNPSETYIDPHSEVTPKKQKSVENIQRIPIGLEEALKDLLPNYLSPGISTQKVAHSEVDATPKKTLADLHGAPSNIRPKPDFEEPANCEEPFDYEGQAYFGEPSDCEEPTDFDPNQSSFPPNHFSPNHTMMHAEIGMVPNGSNNLPPFVNKKQAASPNIPSPSETYIDPHSKVTPKNQKSVENIQRIPIGLEEALKDLLPNYLSPGISTKKVAHSEVDATPKKTLADLHGAPSNIKPKPDFEEPANCEEPFDYEGQAYFGEPSDCEEPTDFLPSQSSFPPNHFSPNHTMMHAEKGMVPNGSNNLPPFVNKKQAASPNIPSPSETYIDPHSKVTPKNQKSVENIQRIPIGLEEALKDLLPNYLSPGISTKKVAHSEVDATPKKTLADLHGAPSNIKPKPDFEEPANCEEPFDYEGQAYFGEPSDCEEPTDFSPNQSSFPPNPNHSMMQAERGMVPNGSNNLPPFVNKIQAAYPNIPNPNPHSEVTPKNQRSLENIQRVPIGLEEALKALLPNYLSPGIPNQKVAYSEVVANPKKTLADVHSTPSNVRPKPDFKEPAHCEEPSNYEKQFYFEEPADCKEPTNFPPNQSSFSPNHTMMHAEMGILHNGPNNLPPFVNKIQAAYPNIPNPSETYRDPHSEVTPKSQKSLENIPIGLEEAFKALLPNYLYPDVQTQKVTHSEVEPSTKNTLVYDVTSHVKPKPNLDEPINPSRNRTINRNMFKSERGLSSNGPPNFTTCFNHNHIVPSKRPIPTQTSTEAYPEELNHRKTLEGVQCIPREVAAAFQLISPNYVPPNLQKRIFLV